MPEPKGGLILSGDIGGTKTNLGMFLDMGDRLELVKEAGFINSKFDGPEEIIKGFIEKNEAGRIEGAAFAIACPVVGNRCKLTNLDWVIDGEEIKKRFRIGKTGLLNDLVAIAWGVDLLEREDIETLQEGEKREGNAALIAAGTGLGEAALVWDGKMHIPSGSEGGHTDFAPRNEIEIELLKYLSGIYGHVSYERIISGPGLENIYNFLKAKYKTTEPEYLKAKFEAEGMAPVISSEGMHGEDRSCKEALALFVSLYGAEAGNLALKTMATGGVFVGGGIAPKILKALKEGAFIESFRKKGRFEKLMSEIPVNVILYDKTGLIGAAAYAGFLTGKGGGKRIKKITGRRAY